MESLNSSNESLRDNDDIVSPLSIPLGVLVAYHLFLIIIIIPVVFFNVLILLALLVDRSTVGIIRLVLCNSQAACLVLAITILVYDIAGMALSFTDVEGPAGIISFCRAILFFLGAGGAARFLFLAVFSVAIYYIVRFHMPQKKESSRTAVIGFAIAVTVLWVVAILGGLPVLFDTIVNNSCSYTVLGGGISVALFVVIFGIGGFTASIIFLLLTVFYIRRHSISGTDACIKKALLKLGFFLLFGNVVSVIGQIVPAIIGAAVSESRETLATLLALFIAIVLINISLIPPPILLVIFFKPIRIQLKKWLCCCCLKTQTLEVGSFSGARERSTFTTRNYTPSHPTA